MQKFTRALTREVEVAGERLAITFDANGMSIRPVGSRREPHTMTWAAVTCAAAGQLPEEVTEALAALRAGAPKPREASAPEAPPKEATPPAAPPPEASAPEAPAHEAPAAPSSDGAQSSPALGAPPASSAPRKTAPPRATAVPLTDVLPRIDDWLARHRPHYHAALNPPATPEQIGALASALGRPLPEELAVWLAWHNGQQEGFHGAFVEAFFLLSAEQIAATVAARQGEDGGRWNSAWAPLLASDQGDLIVLDTAAPGRPVREVWQGSDASEAVAPTLAAWADSLLADLEASRYVEDPERGEMLRVQEGSSGSPG